MPPSFALHPKYLEGMTMPFKCLLLIMYVLSAVYSGTAQDSPLYVYYNELSKEPSLTAREDMMGEAFTVVFYPNGIMRDRFQLTGLIAMKPLDDEIFMSFSIPTEELALDVDESDLAQIQDHFSPWTMRWSPSSVDGRMVLVGHIMFNPDVPAAKVRSSIVATMERLESWFEVHHEVAAAPELEVSRPCQALLDAIGNQGAGLHPMSREMLCSCADWHEEQGYELGQYWFKCSLYSYVIMDPLTPQPMVTCRQPECLIPLRRIGNNFMVELEFPSGQKEEVLLFIEDVLLMLNDNQLAPVMEEEGWNPSDLRRPDHTLSREPGTENEYDHYGVPSFKVGDVTFSAQSVLVPKTGICRPYFSAGLLSALGRWELDEENSVLRITPWAYLVEK